MIHELGVLLGSIWYRIIMTSLAVDTGTKYKAMYESYDMCKQLSFIAIFYFTGYVPSVAIPSAYVERLPVECGQASENYVCSLLVYRTGTLVPDLRDMENFVECSNPHLVIAVTVKPTVCLKYCHAKHNLVCKNRHNLFYPRNAG